MTNFTRPPPALVLQMANAGACEKAWVQG